MAHKKLLKQMNRKNDYMTNHEIWNPIRMIDCECSVNSIDYNATDLIVELERFDNKGIVRIDFKEVFYFFPKFCFAHN